MNAKKINVLLAGLLFLTGTVSAANSKGVFSVSATKTVQFKMENETNAGTSDLFQWSTANAWREEQKNAEGHDGWYALNHEEWSYLLAEGRTDAADLNALGTVNSLKGLIILPDDFVLPSGLTFNGNTMYYNLNTYTAAQWAQMEAAGAVFLPCGGYSADGGSPEDSESFGAYWSSDAYSSDNGYRISFSDGTINDQQHDFAKTNYYSIRLVREVTVLDEADEQSTFETKLSAAKTTHPDFAAVRRTLYKDGAFNTICLPFDVADIEDSPLAGAEVYAFESGEVVDGLLQVNIEKVPGAMAKGVPYLIRWDNTGEILSNLTFSRLTASDWDDATAASVENGNVTYQGFYGKTHITDDGTNHYNFFLGADDELLWPEDGNDASAKMSGFRAYFYITPGGGPSPAPMYRGMPAAFRIRQTATEIEQAQWGTQQAAKVLYDGQVVLIINGETYTLKGQRL